MSAAPQTSPPLRFAPKLFTVLREGYGLADVRADVLAGLTVAIVALPLSMAIAIASGVGPDRGLVTAIIGGFLVSAFGGSRHQIGGPAGAFIVLVAACVASIGLPGLILATFLSGFLLVGAGLLRLGSYIRFIPYPVTLAFSAGIAVIILAAQLRDVFGLTLPEGEPAALAPKLAALWSARASLTPAALGLSALTLAMILLLRRLAPRAPGLLIAVAAAAALAAGLGLPVETIGSRFGALPRLLPAPAWPDLRPEGLAAALPWALSFTLLGAIESLLSAVVADGMSGRRHRPEAELVAQGLANIGSALFGGFCVTGTIARTATNVRAGSRGPISGLLHALFLLLFMLIAAPLAAYIPLAALAAVLVIVAWSMAEKRELWAVMRASRTDAVIVAVTFALVIFRDLTEGILAGFALGSLVFIRRMADAAALRSGAAFAEDPALPEGAVICRLEGAYFFGAAAQLAAALDRIAERPGLFILDLSAVPYIDSSGIEGLMRLSAQLKRRGGRLALVGAAPGVAAALQRGPGAALPLHKDLESALQAVAL